jgi:hypothetical protein
MYLKAFKNLKNPAAKKNLADNSVFWRSKNRKNQTLWSP